MKTEKRRKGDVGEELACKYLKRAGFHILEQNYLKTWGEIDIVAERLGIISFIEVKSVTREIQHSTGKVGISNVSRESFRPEDNMHPGKIKRLHRAIQGYLLERDVPVSKPWQLDLACVYMDFVSKRAHVELIENIVL